MPFGDMTANFDTARRERIELEKDRIRSEISEMEKLVTAWEQEAESANDDVPMVVAFRAMEYERSRLLDELEPLHNDVVKAIGGITSAGATWCRDVMKRVEEWIPNRREDPAKVRDRALEIVDAILCSSDPQDMPRPHELAMVRQALKLIR